MVFWTIQAEEIMVENEWHEKYMSFGHVWTDIFEIHNFTDKLWQMDI